MEDYQVSLPGLLERCQEIFAVPIEKKMLFFDAPEKAKLHYVKRLLIFLSGTTELRYSINGKVVKSDQTEPAIVYSSDKSFFWNKLNPNTPSVAFSFSYFPDFIRGMIIDYDGVHEPPTMRDIFYHSDNPLSAAGMQILDTIEILHNDGQDAIAGELLFPLLRLTLADMQKTHSLPVAMPSRKWSRLCYFIQTHCHEAVSRNQIAALLRITPEYVSNLCRKYSGKSFSELKLSYQMEHAEKLLQDTDLNIEEIALNCGFNSANYFVRKFKSIYGVTPGVFRKNNTGA